jgi:hypothetical protein
LAPPNGVFVSPSEAYSSASTAKQTLIPDADTALRCFPVQELSRFEFTLFSHLINEKINTLFRKLEFGRNPRWF